MTVKLTSMCNLAVIFANNSLINLVLKCYERKKLCQSKFYGGLLQEVKCPCMRLVLVIRFAFV